MAVNISDLNLVPEAVPEVDWNAPEAGSFPPAVTVGVHDFAFALADDPFDTITVDGKNFLQVLYSATTEVEGDERTLNFQRASTFLNDKMKAAGMNHGVGDLLRALGFRIEGPLNGQKIQDALTEATATRRHFRGEVAWRRYCKSCEQTVSTAPRKKKGDVAWPRAADGKPELVVACPKCGDKGYGNADIIRFKLPEGGASTVASSTSVAGIAI